MSVAMYLRCVCACGKDVYLVVLYFCIGMLSRFLRVIFGSCVCVFSAASLFVGIFLWAYFGTSFFFQIYFVKINKNCLSHLEKIAILYFGANVKCPFFWNYDAHIHRPSTYVG
jgi:hypothetical protein